jgi:hypothetical protein
VPLQRASAADGCGDPTAAASETASAPEIQDLRARFPIELLSNQSYIKVDRHIHIAQAASMIGQDTNCKSDKMHKLTRPLNHPTETVNDLIKLACALTKRRASSSSKSNNNNSKPFECAVSGAQTRW